MNLWLTNDDIIIIILLVIGIEAQQNLCRFNFVSKKTIKKNQSRYHVRPTVCRVSVRGRSSRLSLWMKWKWTSFLSASPAGKLRSSLRLYLSHTQIHQLAHKHGHTHSGAHTCICVYSRMHLLTPSNKISLPFVHATPYALKDVDVQENEREIIYVGDTSRVCDTRRAGRTVFGERERERERDRKREEKDRAGAHERAEREREIERERVFLEFNSYMHVRVECIHAYRCPTHYSAVTYHTLLAAISLSITPISYQGDPSARARTVNRARTKQHARWQGCPLVRKITYAWDNQIPECNVPTYPRLALLQPP